MSAVSPFHVRIIPMKKLSFKFWQLLALISGSIIALVLALASISYNATLGSNEPAFALLPISNRDLFSALALAFDLGMVASVFGFWHWRTTNTIAALLSAVLFVIASLFSVHSVRGYIALNLTKTQAPAARDQDVYASLKRGLDDAEGQLSLLRTSLIKSRGRDRLRLDHDIEKQVVRIDELRARMKSTSVVAHVSPLTGSEWFIALTLWLFNASCWTAWFGANRKPVSTSTNASTCSDIELDERVHAQQAEPVEPLPHDADGVRIWLMVEPLPEHDHCARLYERYRNWCRETSRTSLPERRFYARLIELGARKFRVGRNGPMHYQLPHVSNVSGKMEA